MKYIVLIFLLQFSFCCWIYAKSTHVDSLNKIDSSKSFLFIAYDNDIFTKTDRYYSHGLKIEYFPANSKLKLIDPILLSLRIYTEKFNGYSLAHTLYTPLKPYRDKDFEIDRPYAAYLHLGAVKTTINANARTKLTSKIYGGVLGPLAGGKLAQEGAHQLLDNKGPTGWSKQIDNDIILNYELLFEKSIWHRKHFELITGIETKIGTLYDNASLSLTMREGLLDNYFQNLGFNANEKIKAFFFANGRAQIVVYDATLQGGVFNYDKNSKPWYKIKNRVYLGTIGFAAYVKKIRFEYAYVFMSQELEDSRNHRWGRAGLAINF